jgi:hypothetical protein
MNYAVNGEIYDADPRVPGNSLISKRPAEVGYGSARAVMVDNLIKDAISVCHDFIRSPDVSLHDKVSVAVRIVTRVIAPPGEAITGTNLTINVVSFNGLAKEIQEGNAGFSRVNSSWVFGLNTPRDNAPDAGVPRVNDAVAAGDIPRV